MHYMVDLGRELRHVVYSVFQIEVGGLTQIVKCFSIHARERNSMNAGDFAHRRCRPIVVAFALILASSIGLGGCSDDSGGEGGPDVVDRDSGETGDSVDDTEDTDIDPDIAEEVDDTGDSSDTEPDTDDTTEGVDDSSDAETEEDFTDGNDSDDDAVEDVTDIAEEIDEDAVEDAVDTEDTVDDTSDAEDTTDTEVVEPPECETDTLECDGADQRSCVDGEWVVTNTCDFECVEVNDGLGCACGDSLDCPTEQFCNSDGLCEEDVCSSDINGCTDGTVTRCEPDGSAQTSFECGDLVCGDGAFCVCTDDEQCGQDQFCRESKGECVPDVCDEGEQFCTGPLIQECTESGEGVVTVGVCSAGCEVFDGTPACACEGNSDCVSSEYCDGGACVPDKCTPFSRRCSPTENAVEVCRGDGSGYDATDCGAATCSDGSCSCSSDSECEGTDICVGNACEEAACPANENFCVNDSIFVCNDRGSDSDFLKDCPNGCSGGQCVCSGDSDCGDGYSCNGGVCTCPSETFCGDAQLCCQSGDICLSGEFCDASGCIDTSVCAPPCADGERCGARGELCCNGSTPVCGDDNTCEPDCGSNVVCGEPGERVCCGGGELCVFNECQTPGTECDTFADCDFGEYCEPTIGQCLPNDFPDDLVCQTDFDFADFEPTVAWQWEGVEIDNTTYRNIQSFPAVGNVDASADGISEVVVVAYDSGLGNDTLAVVNGANGQTVYSNRERNVRGGNHVALGNIDGDPYLEMAVPIGDGVGMIDDIVNCPDPTSDPDGCYLWTYGEGTLDRELDSGAPGFADFNQDGSPELYVGSVVLDAASGSLIADGGTGSAADGGLNSQYIAAAEDVDADGVLELLTGDCAWDVDFQNNELDEVWCSNEFSQGLPGVADIVDNGAGVTVPEVVVVRNNTIYILRGDNGDLLYEFDQPSNGHGGPPNIADFDRDGRPEIGVANEGCYSVFDIDCIGDPDNDLPGCTRPVFPSCTPGVDCTVEACAQVNNGAGTGDGILWSVATQDLSSSTTGSSVFDFQGDGIPEVVYNGECRFLALDGRNGTPLFSRGNSSRTAGEYPIVVDVNGDNRSEVLIVANNDRFGRCEDVIEDRPDYFPECDGAFDNGADPSDFPEFCYSGTSGIIAFQDPQDRWVRTRSIWNQHAYSITNIAEDGNVPVNQENNWEVFNTFRANRQGGVPLNSPDPAITRVVPSLQSCPPEVEIIATISNEGTRGIPAGLPIRFFYDTGEGDIPFETVVTQEPIFPGGSVVVSANVVLEREFFRSPVDYTVDVNIDENGDPVFPDCKPTENSVTLEDIVCFDPGGSVSN
jgi:hypothetical protein